MNGQVREKRIGNWIHSMSSHCRYGLRQLRKNPGLSSVIARQVANSGPDRPHD